MAVQASDSKPPVQSRSSSQELCRSVCEQWRPQGDRRACKHQLIGGFRSSLRLEVYEVFCPLRDRKGTEKGQFRDSFEQGKGWPCAELWGEQIDLLGELREKAERQMHRAAAKFPIE